MRRIFPILIAALAAVSLHAQAPVKTDKPPGTIVVEPPPAPPVKNPPKVWIDPDTGHRIFRLTDEPNSGAPYFNINAATPDGKSMVYTSSTGIHVIDFATRATRLVVPAPAHFIVVGHKTPSIFFTRTDPATKVTAVFAAAVLTGAVRKLIDLPSRISVITINADETLAAGTTTEGTAGEDFARQEAATEAAERAAAEAGHAQIKARPTSSPCSNTR
jgi:oligogalacturonide lyase